MRAEIDSVNTVKFNLTVDAIEAIFRTYPTGDVSCVHVHMYTMCTYPVCAYLTLLPHDKFRMTFHLTNCLLLLLFVFISYVQ